MAQITHRLVHKDDIDKRYPLYENISLEKAFQVIKTEINVPQHWTVEQIEDNEVTDSCNAGYLMNNYSKETLPDTVDCIPFYIKK